MENFEGTRDFFERADERHGFCAVLRGKGDVLDYGRCGTTVLIANPTLSPVQGLAMDSGCGERRNEDIGTNQRLSK